MGLNSVVKSESWLDLSNIAQQRQQEQQQQQQQQQHQEQKDNENLKLSRLRLVSNVLQQTRRRPFERAISLEPTRESFPAIGGIQGKREHLLIRIRQQSFLERSNSTTLSSSNLSRSIDLDGSLVDQASLSESHLNAAAGSFESRLSSGQHLHGASNQGKSISNTKSITRTEATSRRELSFGLKSFKERFERRRQQLRQSRPKHKLGPSAERAAPSVCNQFNTNSHQIINSKESRNESPFLRSWSSLSERVSLRLTNIGHSWKCLLHKYQISERDSKWPKNDHQKTRLSTRELWLHQNDNRRMSQPIGLDGSKFSDGYHNDQLVLSNVRKRFTSDWVAAQQHTDQVESLEAGLEDLEADNSVFRLANGVKRGSIVITPINDLGPHQQLASKLDTTTTTTVSNRNTDCKPFHTPQLGAARNGCDLSSPLISQGSHSTSSSTTLVSVGQQHLQDNDQLIVLARPQSRIKRLSLQIEPKLTTKSVVDNETSKRAAANYCQPKQTASSSSTNSSSSSVKTMNSNFSRSNRDSVRNKVSSAAPSPTTPVATSDYWSSVKSELAPMIIGPQQKQLHHNQQQQQQQQAHNQAELFQHHNKLDDVSPTSTMMMMSSDQDYYLDVAAASFQQQHEHLAPIDMHLKQTHQQQQQFATGGVHSNQELEVFSGDLDDYDDYAVPSDESCCRLDRSQVELVQLIGEGQKGYVFLGKLQSKDGQSIIDVAIKTLKFETEQLIERLMNEAAMMKQLEHPHIIKFIGMCPETPALIAMELAQFGEIKLYLRLNQRYIKCSQLVLFAFQISTALSYLESKNYVHRDVAARNVLVCSHSCVKLADFGLSRNLQPNFLFTTTTANSNDNNNNNNNGQQQRLNTAADLLDPIYNQQQSLYVAAPRVKLPVRWLAPESLVFRRFTSASDVWMFAVCTWEFFQFGQMRPWAHLRNNQVLAAIELGERLAKPEACPERLYQLMLRAWSYAPVQRPKFREIKQCIWSIYLSERTREQLEMERLERQHRLIMMHQQQQHQQHQPVGLQQLQVPLLAPSKHNSPQQAHQRQQQQQQHHHHQTHDCDQFRTDASQPPGRSSGSSPSKPLGANNQGRQQVTSQKNTQQSSNYSSNLTPSTTATNLKEHRISPAGSSAFNSLNRAEREPNKQQQQQQQTRTSRNIALRTQISRFEQRQACSPVSNNHHRPHLLQKQRSQGAIGMSTINGFEAYDEVASTHQNQANEADQMIGSKATATAARRSNQMKPLDDQALEYVKRGLRQRPTNERQSFSTATAGKTTQALGGVGESESEADDDEDDVDDDEWQEEDEDNLWMPVRRYVSASPALTADVGSQSRVVSIEPAYEGIFVAASNNNNQPNTRGNLIRPNDQIAMLKANFDPSDGSRLSPNSSGPLLASSPALTSSNSPTRPASRRSTPASFMDKRCSTTSTTINNNILDSSKRANTPQRLAARINDDGKRRQQVSGPIELSQNVRATTRQQQQQQQQQVEQQPDQLGAMLQALRITPMKAKLRSSPEQNVRVLQREERRSMVRDESSQMMVDRGVPAPLTETQKATPKHRDQAMEVHHEDPQESTMKQMMLHQRLLGRIRPSSSSPSPSMGGGELSSEQKRDSAKGKRPKSQVVMDTNNEHAEQLVVGIDRGNRSGINSRLPHQNKSVEAVDHSLQILESLMSSGEDKRRSLGGGVASATTTASLPRRPHGR